jgi:nucleotide-binding universal stress UspA family protein
VRRREQAATLRLLKSHDPFRHILAPVDFEAASKRALEVAPDLALKFDAKLTLFHAWDTPAYAYANFYVPGGSLALLEEAAKKQLGETLAEVRKRVPHADFGPRLLRCSRLHGRDAPALPRR